MVRVTIVLISLVLFVLSVSLVHAQVPYALRYTGILEKDGAPLTGEVHLWIFLTHGEDEPLSLCGSEQGQGGAGGEQEAEQQPWSQQYVVQANQGQFSLRLDQFAGNHIAEDFFSKDEETYIWVCFGEDEQPLDGEVDRWIFLERKPFIHSPYALTTQYVRRSKTMTIESENTVQNLMENRAPLSIRDESDSLLQMDGNDIVTSGTLHLQRVPGLHPHNFRTHVHGPLTVDGLIQKNRNQTVQVSDGLTVRGDLESSTALIVDDSLISNTPIYSQGSKVIAIKGYSAETIGSRVGNRDEVLLGSSADRFCFISAAKILGLSSCKVFIEEPENWRESNWKLSIDAVPTLGGDNEMQCSATCVHY